MKPESLVKKTVVIITTVIMSTTLTTLPKALAQRPQDPFEQSQKELVDEVWQIVSRQYVDKNFNGQDWQTVRKEYLSRSYSSSQEAYKAIRQMLQKLNDPFTRFIEPEEFKAMQIASNPENGAIGLNVRTVEKTQEIVVVNPIENTPAYKAGVLSGDVLVKIDGQDTQGLSAFDVNNQLRGKVGTSVILTVRRDQKQLELKIIREKIELLLVNYRLEKTSKGNIGYIRLKQFSATVSGEMQKAIKDLENKQVAGYILDLRSNSGGLLNSVVDIARMWINQGTIFSLVTNQGEIERKLANRTALTNKPLVIIINDGTASGAEILATALQENQQAVLIGSQTIGFNTIQSVRPLEDGSGLAVTVAKWRTPKGKDINKLGISPDVVVNLQPDQQQAIIKNRSFGTISDPQFSKAVEKLTQLIKK